MVDYRQELAETIAAATERNNQRQKAADDERKAQQEAKQKELDQIAKSKSLAYKFRSSDLEKIFAENRKALSEGSYSVVGGSYHDDAKHCLCHNIEANGVEVRGTIEYGAEWIRSHVWADVNQRSIYNESMELSTDSFDRAITADWFKLHLKEAVKAVLESGALPRSHHVGYLGRIL
jgi:hypothetical protein